MLNQQLWQSREKGYKTIPEEEVVERPQRQMTMEDFWRLAIQNEYSVVRRPAIEASNFELKVNFDYNGAAASIHWAS